MIFLRITFIIVIAFRGVAQVVERYFREVEAASSSLVTPIDYEIAVFRKEGSYFFIFLFLFSVKCNIIEIIVWYI